MSEAQVEELYRSHGPIVFRRAKQVLGSDDAAHDVVQEIFESFLSDADQLLGKSSMVGWLYRVATHKCLNRLRDERNRRRILEHPGRSLPEAQDPDGSNR